MAFPFDGSTVALWKCDDAAAGVYGTATDSAAFGGTQRDLTEVSAATAGLSPSLLHILNGPEGNGKCRHFPTTPLSGGPYLWRAGDAASISLLTGTNSYTIEMWIRPDVIGLWAILAYQGPPTSDTQANNFLTQVAIQASGRLRMFWESGSGVDRVTTGTTGTTMTAGNWYHIAISVDNSGATSTVKFYIHDVDGVGGLQQTITGVTKADGGTTANWVLGSDFAAAGGNNFKGCIKDVHISNVVRSDAYIDASAAASNFQHTSDVNTFILWRLDESPDMVEQSTYGYHLRKVIGTHSSVASLIDDTANGALQFVATEYDGHVGYEPLRSTFAGTAWSLEWWGQLGSLHHVVDRGLFCYGDPSQSDVLANNVFGIDLLANYGESVRAEGSFLRFVGERATAIREDTSWTMPTRLFPADEAYDRHYVALTHSYSSTTLEHTYKLYVDGELRHTRVTSLGFEGGTSSYMRLGVGTLAGFHPFAGKLDDLRVSNVARTAVEIAATWEGRGTVAAPTVTYPTSWPMDSDTLCFHKFNAGIAGGGYATANDSAPGARHLAEVGTPAQVSHAWLHTVNAPAGASGGGYAKRFSATGTDHYQLAGDAGSVALFLGSYSIEAWIRPDIALTGVIYSYAGPASETEANNFLAQLYVNAGGRLGTFWESGGGTDRLFDGSAGTVMVPDTWYHVCATVDYSGASAIVKLYIDGALQQTSGAITKATGGTSANHNLGGQQAGNQFSGAIRSLRISSKVRSDAEVAASAALSTYEHPVDADTFAHWLLDEAPDSRCETPYGYHWRKVAGAIGVAAPLVQDGGYSRYMEAATEYAGHYGYEPMRAAFVSGDWSFDCWFKMGTGYASAIRGFWVHGDPGPETEVANFISLDLLTTFAMQLFQETGAGLDNIHSTPKGIWGTTEDGYEVHYLCVTCTGSGPYTYEWYLDGALLFTTTTALAYTGGTSAWLRVSSGQSGGSNSMVGYMDNARWTARRATPEEVAGAYVDGLVETVNCLVVTPITSGEGDPEDEKPLNTWLRFSVTDPQAMLTLGGSNKPVEVDAIFPDLSEVTIWDGTAFHASYLGSYREEILGGHNFFVRPASAEWPPTAVTIRVKEL